MQGGRMRKRENKFFYYYLPISQRKAGKIYGFVRKIPNGFELASFRLQIRNTTRVAIQPMYKSFTFHL